MSSIPEGRARRRLPPSAAPTRRAIGRHEPVPTRALRTWCRNRHRLAWPPDHGSRRSTAPRRRSVPPAGRRASAEDQRDAARSPRRRSGRGHDDLHAPSPAGSERPRAGSCSRAGASMKSWGRCNSAPISSARAASRGPKNASSVMPRIKARPTDTSRLPGLAMTTATSCIDGHVGPVHDHRDQTVEPWTAERALRRASSPCMVRAVRHDHRTLADDEPDPHDVVPMTPPVGVGAHGEHLPHHGGVPDHREP